ncbi:bifunctional DNA primase/polymerase [Chitinophaga cymbidii]|uniref:bifunctional DNA primase/polymerase n=1 Tax=Chitinophaga cymbidii TaxID=1096750 RepID=UPI0011BD6566|nr:bifunctional DNA primase/polymerase [Chitinophaga cymbidii]
MNDLLTAALQYNALGFSVVAVNAVKKPVWRWNQYRKRPPTIYELEMMFSRSDSCGIGIVCGEVSGNFVGIDMDIKNDLTGTLHDGFQNAMNEVFGLKSRKFAKATTRSGGFHWYYRCEEPTRSQHLAQRPTAKAERLIQPNETVKVLIESCAEGSIIVVPPTPGYTYLQQDLCSLPLITMEQQDRLFSIARRFHQIAPGLRTEKHKTHPCPPAGSPFEDYNQRGDVIALLLRHNWQITASTNVKTIFRRPGDTKHDTSGDFHHELGLFTVLTTSTAFERWKGYKPSAVFAILECNGDFTLAAKKLIQLGYGIPYKKQR